MSYWKEHPLRFASPNCSAAVVQDKLKITNLITIKAETVRHAKSIVSLPVVTMSFC